MTVVSFREYLPITVCKALSSPTESVLTHDELDALEALGKQLNITIIEHISRTKVRPRQFVGSVQVGDRLLEFLPKIEPEGLSDLPVVRQNLLQMLLVAHDLELSHTNLADLTHTSGSWLDLLMRFFCNAFTAQLRHGLVKRYRVEEDDLPVVRGRLLLDEQVSRNFIHKERMACEFDELDENHPLNQAFKWVIGRMLRLAQSERTQQAARELLLHLSAVSDVPINRLNIAQITLDRSAERFRMCWELAKLFITGNTSDIYAGAQQSFALLFDMNDLFEGYIGKTFQRALRQHPTQRVRLQHSERYLVKEVASGQRLFKLRPDIVIVEGDTISCIVDTKWKRLLAKQRKAGVLQSDLYQMYAYAGQHQCDSIVLLYPWNPDAGELQNIRKRFQVEGSDVCIKIAEVSLYDLSGVPAQLLGLLSGEVSTAPLTAG
ncbi:hypothetical protein HX875_16980 [Pseudomonas yamanorum]|uniref:5-methylcytosine-specific restriction enzyme subunit McrC n=1 Tax=Pseudomonas yamanorum TaxID=515393 RepID=A0A7Y8K801_9PSED|nr:MULTISPECIES: hypothetical protein [Pseudomonas]NWE41169.1 hypothetical protein [Pseudomonas yamanorum]NWE78115.1 hypothetical protein [Pseudomonas yamanorum]